MTSRQAVFHEEHARRNLRKSLFNHGEIKASDSHDDGWSYIEGNDHAFLVSSPFSRI
jgi:hypothetical protein